MISTSFMAETGLKKCIPTTLSGLVVAIAISVIESDDVFVFENAAELRAKCGNQFICPNCGGISTDPYKCNSGKEVKGKICDWKAYGLLQFGLCFCYCKEERKGTRIFMPFSLQKKPCTRNEGE